MAAFSLLGWAQLAAAGQSLPPPWLPIEPGMAQCRLQDGGAELANDSLRFTVRAQGRGLRPAGLQNRFTHHTQRLEGELFGVTFRDGREVNASGLEAGSRLTCNTVSAKPDAARAAERRNGVALRAEFRDRVSGLSVLWRAVLRDGSNYLREELEFTAQGDIDLASVRLIDLQLDGSRVAGTAAGSPVAAGDDFYGFEHPMSQALALRARATAELQRVLPLRAGVHETYSAVLGVAPRGQLRRGFLAYLESERAAPFRTFLHYNSWYDIGYFTPYTQQEAACAINAFGQKLVRERGVTMDSFLFDDGWDDPDHLWQFSRAFPDGFSSLRTAAESYGAEPGMWLSPWGGYDQPRARRLAAAKAGGYEVHEQGIALSGKNYYRLFHDTTVNLLRSYGINQFKLDGTGGPDKVTAGSAFDSDFAAAIALIGDLRAIKPDLFINLTTGTWPSPFWLRTADSIWRGGEDHGFAGVGSDRQRWITYRDGETYGGIVRQGPLFPLNSLMLHGLIFARHARGLDSDPHEDFADEVHSYFASGTGLQEMYISPGLLSERNWDTLAKAAKWARANAVTLRDSHWIGGDPARLQVYGWAAWSPGHAIVALRNPGDEPQAYSLELGRDLELPDGAARAWRARSAFDAHARQGHPWRAGVPAHIRLAPFEVLVWDLFPARARR